VSCAICGIVMLANVTRGECNARLMNYLAAFLTILIVSSFSKLLSLLFKNPYCAIVYTIWIRRLTRIAEFIWLSIFIQTVKDDSPRNKCIVDQKTNNLILLIIACSIICAALVTIDFVQEIITLVGICIQAHNRKNSNPPTRFLRLKSWFASRETA
jgi:hypothetical protein